MLGMRCAVGALPLMLLNTWQQQAASQAQAVERADLQQLPEGGGWHLGIVYHKCSTILSPVHNVAGLRVVNQLVALQGREGDGKPSQQAVAASSQWGRGMMTQQPLDISCVQSGMLRGCLLHAGQSQLTLCGNGALLAMRNKILFTASKWGVALHFCQAQCYCSQGQTHEGQ